MNKTKSILLLLSLSLIGQAQSAPVTVTPSSTVLMKRITPAQLSGGSSGITSYSDQCSGRTATWSAGGTCSSPTTALSNGASQTVSSTNGNTGSATFVCDGSGNRLILQPGSTCSNAVAGANDPCSSQTVTWGSCSATAAGRNHNQTVTVTDSTSPATGNATFTCNDTSYVFSSGSCSEPSTTCTSKTLNWSASGNNCASVSGVTNDGANKTLSNTLANGNTGSATFSCSAGSDSYSIVGSPTCAPPAPTACTSKALNWSSGGNSCSALSGTTNDGAAKTVSNTASNGNTGSATYVCNAATDSYTMSGTPTCNPPAPTTCSSQTLTWTVGSLTCSAQSGVSNDQNANRYLSTNSNAGRARFVCNAASNTYSPTTAFGQATCYSRLKFTNVDRADSRVCGITTAGSVMCWGHGENIPVLVPGLESGVTDISTTSKTTCVIQNGAAKCWGDNSSGELGDGTNTNRQSPTQVAGLTTGVTKITTALAHTCAIHNGAAKCWGLNQNDPTRGAGRLGDGTQNNSNVPRQVVGLTSNVTDISADSVNTCAIHNAEVKCWGDNDSRQLGVASPSASTTPVTVPSLPDTPSKIVVGAASACAMFNNGSVSCWGSNFFGALGAGLPSGNYPPTAVTGLGANATFLSGNNYSYCAIISGGKAKCWGYNGEYQLNDLTIADKNTPTDSVGLNSGVSFISAGSHIKTYNGPDGLGGGCFIHNTLLKCLGSGVDGANGNGASPNSQVSTLQEVYGQ